MKYSIEYPRPRLNFVLLTILLGAGLVAGNAAGDQVQIETADVHGQGFPAPIVSPDGARLIRSDTGITISVRMPTPEPLTYAYPPGNAFNPDAEPGHPEVYSLWGFVFNFPEDCDAAPCTLDDFLAGRGAPGAFNVAGHVVGGPTLQLSGHISLESEQFGGASRLLMPRTAEVHVAVAPHGRLQSGAMPAQIKTPIGSSDYWWMAFFLPE